MAIRAKESKVFRAVINVDAVYMVKAQVEWFSVPHWIVLIVKGALSLIAPRRKPTLLPPSQIVAFHDRSICTRVEAQYRHPLRGVKRQVSRSRFEEIVHFLLHLQAEARPHSNSSDHRFADGEKPLLLHHELPEGHLLHLARVHQHVDLGQKVGADGVVHPGRKVRRLLLRDDLQE